MQKSALRLVAGALACWLGERVPARGKHTALALAAEAGVLTSRLPDGPECDPPDHAGVVACLEWLFAEIVTSHEGDHWPAIAAHALRLLALEHVAEIEALVSSPRSLDTQALTITPMPGGYP